MNLIQDDQLAFVIRKVPGGVGELGALILVLKIQVYRSLLFAYLQSQGGLPGLARPQQDYGRRVAKQVIQAGAEAAGQHLCNYRTFLHICKPKNWGHPVHTRLQSDGSVRIDLNRNPYGRHFGANP